MRAKFILSLMAATLLFSCSGCGNVSTVKEWTFTQHKWHSDR